MDRQLYILDETKDLYVLCLLWTLFCSILLGFQFYTVTISFTSVKGKLE